MEEEEAGQREVEGSIEAEADASLLEGTQAMVDVGVKVIIEMVTMTVNLAHSLGVILLRNGVG